MLAFDIRIGEERICLAGVDDWSILSAHLTAQRGDQSDDIENLELYVGGMTKADSAGTSHHVRWSRLRQLEVGTTVTIHVVDADATDMPIKRYRSDHEVRESAFTDEEIEQMQREDWLRLKAKFEPDLS
ncbi:MAG: hypothetical protein ACKOPM_13025 [Novosphingobium sp.]